MPGVGRRPCPRYAISIAVATRVSQGYLLATCGGGYLFFFFGEGGIFLPAAEKGVFFALVGGRCLLFKKGVFSSWRGVWGYFWSILGVT